MRIMPACLYHYDRQEQTEEDISEDIINGIDAISGLTHNHLRSKIACGLYYYMVREIIRSKTAGDGRRLIDILQEGINHGLRLYGKDKNNLLEMTHYGRLFYLTELLQTPEEEIYSNGYVVDSIEVAVWCLISTESFRDCLLKAVNLGKDTDTVAAIAGGLGGLFYGVENISKEWLGVIARESGLKRCVRGWMKRESIYVNNVT